MKKLFNFDRFLNESKILDQKLEDHVEDFIKMYPEMDEPGYEWEVMYSSAEDARHYPTEDYPTVDEEVLGTGLIVQASSAIEALMIFLRDEYDYEVWGEDVTVYEGDHWMRGGDSPHKESDWFFDDGCFDGDVYHWLQISVIKKKGPVLTPKELKQWNTWPYKLRKKFADSRQSYTDFAKANVGAIGGAKYKI